MKKNQIVNVVISDITSDGNGVGRVDSEVIFVPFSAIQDELKVQIVKVKKNFCYGKILEILKPSIDRIDSDCDVFGKCGGCVFRHINYDAQCKLKKQFVENNMRRIGGFKDFSCQPIICLPERRNKYRNKAQYPVQMQDGRVIAGFYSPRSHRVNECQTCLLQPPVFAEIVAAVKEYVISQKISVYNEVLHTGSLRHIYIRTAEATGEIMVVLVINDTKLKNIEVLRDKLKELLGEKFASLQYNINTDKTNVILGNKCIKIYGKDSISDVLCGLEFRISPLSFYQVNRTVAELIYKKAAEYAEPSGKIVLDLYCGAGTIGISMADKAKQIIGVEIVKEAVEDAIFNARKNQVGNVRFICDDAYGAAKMLKSEGIKPDVIVVDPPRKGCDEALLKIIANDFDCERIVYVSCDSATLARDCKILCELGYRLKEVTPVDLFPATAHVESVCLLEKDTVKAKNMFCKD
ncbi:MAG: 23S rRNA (uracil(1939)-C(5))-methyltransferase RlmD [bacterium]|nr:23S rRNA (uracil(1939)-C(5))-methyltransferase RlmD [bacterium]